MDDIEDCKEGIPVKLEIEDHQVGTAVYDFLDGLVDCKDPVAQFIVEEHGAASSCAKVEPVDTEDVGDNPEKHSQQSAASKPSVRFICDICNHGTLSKKALRRHVLTHMMPTLKCDMCDYQAKFVSSLKKHVWKHSNAMPYVCDICDYQTKHFAAFKTHKWKHTGEKPYACEMCDYRASRIGCLRLHMAKRHHVEEPDDQKARNERSITNSGSQSSKMASDGGHIATKGGWFFCHACDYKSRIKRSVIRHMMSHSGEKPYACNLCNYRCIESQRLRRHMMVHTGEKPFACDLCDYRSTARVLLQQHMKNHTIGRQPRQAKFRRKRAICPLCDCECSPQEMARHILKGHGQPPYSCRFCDYKGDSSQALNRHHSMTHNTSERLFSCEYCTYSSNNTTHLNDHMRIHTGEKPYRCSYCPFKARQKVHLKSHMMLHTGERPYACDTCGYRTSQKGHLKMHIKSCMLGRTRTKKPKPPKNQHGSSAEPATPTIPAAPCDHNYSTHRHSAL